MKKNANYVVRVVAFLALAGILVIGLTKIYSISNKYSEHAEMMVKGFYEQKKDTLDAIAIGSSRVYRYFQPVFAWEEYGISSSDFSTSDMPCGVFKNIAIETLKTQSPKVLLFEVAAFSNTEDEANNKIYLLLDNMKYSKNYFDMLKNFIQYHGIEKDEILNYVFPLLQFHSRWSDTKESDFIQMQKSYLNSCYQKEFLTYTIDENGWAETEERTQISENSEKALRDLLEWSQAQKDVKVIFWASPVLKGKKYQARLNYVGDIIEEYGMEFRNYNKKELFDSLGFDATKDFQDTGHTNINGARKFTRDMCSYLKETYDLTDHRGEEQYASWDALCREYHEKVDEYLYE